MSTEITVSMVEQYRDNVIHLAQQKGSKLMSGVRYKDVTGKSDYFERIGASEAVERTSRHADTPLVNTPHSRRKVTLRDFEWADLVDKQDDIRLLIDPASEYTKVGAFAMGRKVDDLILEAGRGTSYAGESGGTSVSFLAANRIAHGSAGITIEKLVQGRKLLENADVDPDFEEFHIAVTPNQIEEMLLLEKVTSTDYSTIQGLMTGDPVAMGGNGSPGYLGLYWHKTTRTKTKAGEATTRDCMLWAKSGIGLGVGQDIDVKISERNDKSHAKQVYLSMTMEATRIEEEKVVIIECDES